MSQVVLNRLNDLMHKRNLSASQVAIELGYRTPNTIYHWIQNKRIPRASIEKVMKYINTKKGEVKK